MRKGEGDFLLGVVLLLLSEPLKTNFENLEVNEQFTMAIENPRKTSATLVNLILIFY